MSASPRKPPASGFSATIAAECDALRRDAARAAEHALIHPQAYPAERQRSARNLLAYLTLRAHDLGALQDSLAELGLSSLQRAEMDVLATLDAVSNQLLRRKSNAGALRDESLRESFTVAGAALLERNTERLLGPTPERRRARIMVTLPDAAANNRPLLDSLLKHGMNCARINCAYGDQATWSKLLARLGEAESDTGAKCRIFMDLRGPKLRTGPMAPEENVVQIRPARADDGRVLRPARIWLTPFPLSQPAAQAADACLVLDGDWVRRLAVGNRIRLRDARGSKRSWRVVERTPSGCWVESSKTTYVKNGTKLRRKGGATDIAAVTTLDTLASRESQIEVRQGDVLLLTRDDTPGSPSIHGLSGELLRPGRTALAVPEVFRDARAGEPISFDDNRISGVIEQINDEALRVRIRHTRRPIEKLSSYKGVNLPTSALALPALSDEDISDLDFVVAHADIIGLSFTNSAEDVRCLRKHLRRLGREDIGVIFKIETRRGCANLPGILLEALKLPDSGVMIARGDLAAECGFEHLAEVQEDILRLCSAAHLPVIWATGVLDRMAKRGHPQRAEITDAYAAQRAECVMLGKGQFILRALGMLDDILTAAKPRQYKQHTRLHDLQNGPIPLDTPDARARRTQKSPDTKTGRARKAEPAG